jgi:hypothetical protein
VTVRRGWFTRQRYGHRAVLVRSIVAFGVLVAFAGCTIIESSHLMSNNCIDSTGQIVCPVSGPDWARPLPGAAVLLGVISGLVGVLAGRPIRTPALIAGFLLTAAGLVGSRLIG